jgi:hypothetical protein
MLADGLRRDPDPETLLDRFDELSSVPCALLRKLLLEKTLASSVMRGGLPGALPSAKPSKPCCSQRSKSRQTLARLRPV